MLADVFGMPLTHVEPAAMSVLWERICADHEAFLARETLNAIRDLLPS